MCSEEKKFTPTKSTIKGPRIVRIEASEVTPKPLTKKQRKALEEESLEGTLPPVSNAKSRSPEIDSETPLVYVNKKGQEVVVEVSAHARYRFMHRWPEAMPDKDPRDGRKHSVLAKWFNSSSLFKASGRRYDVRRKRHGKDTLYFKQGPFVFVVQSAHLRTVEIGSDDKRHLNKFWETKKARKNVPIEPVKLIVCNVWANLESPRYGDCYIGCGKFKIQNFNDFKTDMDLIEQVRQCAIEKAGGQRKELGGGFKFQDATVTKIYACRKSKGSMANFVDGVDFITVKYK